MKIKTLIKGCNFSDYQHIVVQAKGDTGIVSLGGGYPDYIARRFGEKKIESIAIYENIVRVRV